MVMCMLGYKIVIQPVPVVLAQPREEDTKKFLSTKFVPIAQSCEALDEKIIKSKRGGDYSVRKIDFHGGYVALAHSGSPASMRSTSAALVIADEIDLYKGNVDSKNPLGSLRQRMATFGKAAKFIVLSTPTVAGESLIEAEYKRGDARQFWLTCQECEIQFVPTWEHNVVINREEKTGIFHCYNCGTIFDEVARKEMIEAGFWEAQNPFNGNASFHISQLASPLVDFSDTVKAYFDSEDERTFKTQILAETYSNTELDNFEPDELREFATPIPFVEDAVTVGVDVQKNRLEFQIVYWNDARAWINIHAAILHTEDGTSWDALEELCREHDADNIYIDCSYKTDEVTAAIDKHFGYWKRRDKISGVKGLSRASFGESLNASRKLGIQMLAVDEAKRVIWDMVDGGFMSFNPVGLPRDFYEQFSAERLDRQETVRGNVKLQWVKIRERNEAFDCAVYALCARRYLGMNFKKVREVKRWSSSKPSRPTFGRLSS